jgi:hypothetical protein
LETNTIFDALRLDIKISKVYKESSYETLVKIYDLDALNVHSKTLQKSAVAPRSGASVGFIKIPVNSQKAVYRRDSKNSNFPSF